MKDSISHRFFHAACLVMALCFVESPAYAQVADSAEFAVGVYGTGAGPQGDFGDVIDDAMPGIDVQGRYLIPETPFSIGLEAGYLHYGNEHRNAAISETIPDVRVRVNRNNQILRAGLVLRYEQPFGKVTPHVEGMVGLNHLWTSTNVDDRYTLIPSVTSTTLRDTAFAGGVGGGLMVDIYRDDDEGYSVAVDTAIRYTSGGEATYLTKGDVTIDDQNVVHLNRHTTRTDLMDVRIGVVVRFK